MDNKARVQRALVPPRLVRLNVNAEVPTPFVVPWTWYIKQRVYWPLPKLLCVTVTADGEKDGASYAGLVHEDKQFGLRVSFNQTTALEKYAGYHLVSISKVGQAQLHYSLRRSACPCSSSKCNDAWGKACPAIAPFLGNGTPADGVTAGPAAWAPGQTPASEAGQPAVFPDVQGVSKAVPTRTGCAVREEDKAPGLRRSGAGVSSSDNTKSIHSIIIGPGGGWEAGGAAGPVAAAGIRTGSLAMRRAAGGDSEALGAGAGGRRAVGMCQRRHSSGGGRRSSASGVSSGAGGDSSADEGGSSSSSLDEQEEGGASAPVPNNPFRKNCCSCPCHVWRMYWPDPDDPRKNQVDEEELLLEREWKDHGRGRGSRESRGPQRRSRSRSVDTDADWRMESGRGRKRNASVEAEARARVPRRPRVVSAGPPRPPVAPPVVSGAGPNQPGERMELVRPPLACTAGAVMPGSGAAAAVRHQLQARRAAGTAVLPPLPPAADEAAAVQPRSVAVLQCAELQGSRRPAPLPMQSLPPVQPPPMLQHTRAPSQETPMQGQTLPTQGQQQQTRTQQREPQRRRSASQSDDGGKGSGAVSVADGGLLPHGTPVDHVSVEDADCIQCDSQGDGADQLDSSLCHSRQQPLPSSQHFSHGPQASGGGRSGPGRGGGMGPSTQSPPSPSSQTLQPQPARDAVVAGAGTGASTEQQQRFFLSAAECAKLRRASAIVAKARRRAAVSAGGSTSPTSLGGAAATALQHQEQPRPGLRSPARVQEQRREQLLCPLQLSEPPRESLKGAERAKPGGLRAVKERRGRDEVLQPQVVPRSPELVNEGHRPAKQPHKRLREDELPNDATSGAVEPAPGCEPSPSSGHASAVIGQLPPCGGSGLTTQQQRQPVHAGSVREAPPGAAAVAEVSWRAATMLAPPGRPICRPAWDVKPLECGTTLPRVGASIEGSRLVVDPTILPGGSGRGLCYLRLFVEKDGFVDGYTAAECVRVKETGRAVMFTNVPTHAQGCIFLGWGELPGGSLVLRVLSAPQGAVGDGAAAAAGAAPDLATASAAVGTVGAAILDRGKKSKCLQGTVRSPASDEITMAAALAATAGPGARGPSGMVPVPRSRKMVRLRDLLERAPGLPERL